MGRKPVNKKSAEIVKLDLSKKEIAFVNDDVTYTISDNVIAKCDFEKFKIGKGTLVEVSYNDENIVSFIKKMKQEKKEEAKQKEKSEPKEQTEPEQKTEVKGKEEVWTIKGITPNKEVMKFYEQEDSKKWYKLSDEVKEKDLTKDGVVAKAKVRVSLTDDVIVSLEVVEEKKKEEPVESSTTSDTNLPPPAKVDNYKGSWAEKNDIERDKQTSIVRQCAWKGACDFCKSYVDRGESHEEVIKKIKELAEEGLKFIESK